MFRDTFIDQSANPDIIVLMELAATILGYTSSGLGTITYLIYFRGVIDSKSILNPATWLIWSAINVGNLISYLILSDYTLYKISLSLVVTFFVCAITLYGFSKGKTSKISPFDWIILIGFMLILPYWFISKSAENSNVLIQILFGLSYLPTIRGLTTGTIKETALPWYLAFVSYLLLLTSLLLNYSGVWQELVYPIVNGLLGNLSIAIIATIQKRMVNHA